MPSRYRSDDFPETGRLTKDDHLLISEGLPKITGWLYDECAYLTSYLLNFQLERGIQGPALEIGVYHGKYMAVLVHSERKRRGWVGGYDIFEQCHQDTPIRHFVDLFGTSDGAVTWKADSKHLTPESILRDLGFPPRFISVDGDHSPEGTAHDLRLAAAVGMDEVIIAADDVFNISAIGVSEGLYRFLFDTPDVVPFAYGYNKMFLCRKRHFAAYTAAAMAMVEDFPFLEASSDFRDKLRTDRGLALQRLRDNDIPVWLITGFGVMEARWAAARRR